MQRFYGSPSGGYTLIYAVAMSLLLLFSSLAYLQWQVSAQYDARREIATTQAYYVAQAAVISIPLAYMRNRSPDDLATYALYTFPDGTIPGMGSYRRPMVEAVQTFSSIPNATLAGYAAAFKLSAVGIVTYNDFLNRTHEVRRKAQLMIKRQYFSNYFYLTDLETTRAGLHIYFWQYDTLKGRVHSNDQIALIGGYFTRPVSSCYPAFLGAWSNATFLQGYHLSAPHIDFPYKASYLRAAAAAAGAWLPATLNQTNYALYFHGTQADMWSWEAGTPSPYLTHAPTGMLTWTPSTDYPIFSEGDLWISGYINGRVGIGSENTIKLMDNLTYEECQSVPYYPDTTRFTNMTTLISEAYELPPDPINGETGVIVANTVANGRDNGAAYPQSDQAHRDIGIDAMIIALNSTFGIEQENIPGSPYLGPSPDERGMIYIRGAIAQHRRGVVHWYYNDGTGYNKGYLYDERFKYVPPPFIMDASSAGMIQWAVDGWEDFPRHPGDERNE